jgi:uncharacterized DUF497 family protein
MHPRDAEGFEWDEGNEDELWDPHRILPWEVEDVFWNRPVWVKNKKEGSGDYKMVGATNGRRMLTIVVEVKAAKRLLRPITGWPSTKGELSRYGRGQR